MNKIKLRSKVLALIDKEKNEIVDYLQRLIRIRSITGNEAEIARFVADSLESMGFSVSFAEGIMGRPNVIGTYGEDVVSPSLLMITHMDTVDINDLEAWSFDPFDGEINNGKVYGRGSADVKAGLTSMLMAIKTLISAEAKMQGKLVVIASIGEETMDPYGAGYAMNSEDIRTDAALYCHGGPTTKIRRHWKGKAYYEITTKGVPASVWAVHLYHAGINAISNMTNLIKTIDETGLQYERHEKLGDSAWGFTTIEGSSLFGRDNVPGTCKVLFNVRLVPGQTPESVKKELEGLIDNLKEQDPDFDAVVNMTFAEKHTITDTDEPIYKLVMNAATEVIGMPPKDDCRDAAGELRYAFNRGIKGIAYGPGDMINIHKPNESVEISELIKATKIYALVLLDYLYKTPPSLLPNSGGG